LGCEVKQLNVPALSALSLAPLPEEAGESGEFPREIHLTQDGEEKHLKVKVVPTVFDDGSRGLTLIIEDVTLPTLYEQKLRINEARYRAIVEDQTELICRFTPDYSITFVNDAVCQYLGKTREEIIRGSYLDFIAREDRDLVKSRIFSLSKNNPVQTGENRAIDMAGETCWQQWTHRAIFNDSGIVAEYQGVGKDITEKKKAEQDLIVKDMAIASSISGIGIADMQGRLTYSNAAFLKMFGYEDPGEILQLPIMYFAHQDDEDAGFTLGVTQALREKGEWRGEVAPYRRDGSRFFAHLSANLVRDNQGIPICMMVSFIDITASKEAEREIHIKNTAIESAINGIVIFDPTERPIYANQSYLKMFGFASVDEMNAKKQGDYSKMLQAMQPSSREIVKILRDRGNWVGEVRTKKPDGSTIYFQLSATLVKDNQGSPICSMATFMDITDHKLVEKALKSTYEKLQEAIEFMPDPTYIVDRNNKVIAWNRALEALTGVKKEEVLTRGDYARVFTFFGDARPLLIDILNLPAHELAKSYPNVRRFGDSIFVEAFVPGLHGGRGAYLWGKATPLFDREGNSVGAIESLRDMSEWKRAKESLAHAREKEKEWIGKREGTPGDWGRGWADSLEQQCLESILDQLPEGVVIVDTEGRIHRTNKSFLHLVQYPRDEVVGKDISEFCMPGGAEGMKDILKNKSENGNTVCEVALRSGKEGIPASIEISRLRTAGGTPLGNLILVRMLNRNTQI
ncbi:MAG: PAS domain S-box protein, partial [Methanolinea sp.]|nr:PAS domain S-box protein [Methanolinea sp.]